MPIGNTAPASVRLMPTGREVHGMDAEYRDRLLSYRASMSLAAEMLSEGIITRKEYERIDRIIAKSRGLDLCGICCRNPLISPRFRGNMAPTKEGGEGNGTDD